MLNAKNVSLLSQMTENYGNVLDHQHFISIVLIGSEKDYNF